MENAYKITNGAGLHEIRYVITRGKPTDEDIVPLPPGDGYVYEREYVMVDTANRVVVVQVWRKRFV